MNILVLSPFLPWPLNQGGKIRLFNIIKNLSRTHTVTLAALVEERNASDPGPLRQFCRDVILVERPARLWPDRVAFFSGSDPYNVVRYRSAELRRELLRLLQSARFDLVHVEFPMMWQYAGLFAGIPVALGTQNIEYRIVRQIGRAMANPLVRLIYRLEEKRLRTVEERAWREAALCCAVSEPEREEIAACTGDASRIFTVPNGVDLERFTFRARESSGGRILFLGGMDYNPNLDAARYFLDEIFPLIRQQVAGVKLLMVGRELWRLNEREPGFGNRESVEFHENVPEVLPWFYAADVLAVPLRQGAGTRVKVLEAFAAGLPVVSTSKGCEGLGATNGTHLLVADTPDEFAAAVQRVFSDFRLKDSLAAHARQLVESRYSWQSVVETMVQRYGAIAHG